MTLAGFKRMTIRPRNADGSFMNQLVVIEGKRDKGATTTAEISGLSKTPTKVAGSDIEYYISRKGVGDVKSDFGVLDMPDNLSDLISGYKVSAAGITHIGNDTEPPYCAVLLESSDLQGDTALLGFYDGTFTRDKISLDTLDPAETFKPTADTYTYSSIASDADGETNGQYVGKYIGSKAETIEALKKEVLGEDYATVTDTAAGSQVQAPKVEG
ncbi:hypothetical protein [Lactobacillus curvatus] [Lactiplantibacillus mudanjiangensis]|uniref:major tail protein n=1 Tax=Lactiplantibacillus mudanjiangensis TaxID=1296538 RepID=UPI001015923A|nr:hypothetical protein [Lactobacillus curvatus] [Lactiplantibacillus mudanjiangensis]